MAPLVTKTIRITQDQELELASKFKGASSFLFRELFHIFSKSETPGIEIIKLRKKISEEIKNDTQMQVP